jgi:hypothetical protein
MISQNTRVPLQIATGQDEKNLNKFLNLPHSQATPYNIYNVDNAFKMSAKVMSQLKNKNINKDSYAFQLKFSTGLRTIFFPREVKKTISF